MSQISKISINGTEYNLSEKLSSYYISYESPAFPEPGDSVETAISKLHTDVELLSVIGNLSEDYTAYTTSLGAEPQPYDSIELAISKLHRVILDDEYTIATSLIDINEKSFHMLYLDYVNNSYAIYDENNNEIPLDGDINLYDYVNEHSIIKSYITGKIYYYVEYHKFISIDNQTIYWIEFTSGQQGNYIIQVGQQLIESQFINSTAYNISQSDITNWNSKLDSFTETDPTVASYIKAITQSDITNWNSKTSNVGTITGITMNGASKGTSGVVDLGTVITDISGKADTSAAIGSLSLSMNSSTYVITLSGAKVDGTTFTVNDSIDLPLESVVVDGEYNSTTKKVVLTLKSGSTVEFSIADLINGLQSEITSTNKLSADLISDGTTNKTVTQTEKNSWNSKLDSFTETDPTVASYIKSITQSDITYWNSKLSTAPVTSVNGQTGAVNLTIPDDSNLVHKTGNETITGNKQFLINEENSININTNGITLFSGSIRTNNWDWIALDQKGTSDDETLQQALDKRNNVQADWNQTTTTAADYIKNKPDLTTYENKVTSVNGQTGAVTLTLGDTNVIETVKVNGTTLTPDGNKAVDITIPEGQLSYNYATSTLTNDDLGLAYGDTYEEAFGKLEKAILDNELVVTNAITDLDARILDTESLATVAKSGSYNDLTNRPTIPSKTSDLTNDSGFLTSAPVTSVNGQQGAVTLTLGQTNVIETVKVNNTALTPDANKAVNITVPTKTSDLTNDNGFITAETKANWTETNTSSAAYIQNKPNIVTGDGSTYIGMGVYSQTATKLFIGSEDSTKPTLLSSYTYVGLFSSGTKIATLNDIPTPPTKTSDLTNDSGFITSAPVTSVNNQTGAVTLALGDTNVIETVKVNNTALTPVSKAVNITVPTKTSDLTNDSGFLTSAPVTSVNNQTGAVTLTLGDANVIETVKVNNTALTPVSKAVNITVPTKTSDLTNDSGFITSAPVTSVNGQTGAVTVKANVQSDWNATTGDAVILNKPTIPTVSNSTVTITMNGATVGTFTLNKSGNTTINLGTVLTAHQSIKTINNQTITGTGNVDISGLPTVTSADNGKVLMVVNGAWQLVSPVTLYSGSGTPANSQGNNGDLYVQS